MSSAHVYILASRMHGALYIGVTTKLVQRIWQHKNELGAGFTSRHKIFRLVHVESFDGVLAARAREKTLKGWKRSWKITLIEKTNPAWRDLYDEIQT